ncbi:TraM recognition domain-containing protein [Dactylosporangium sp. NBC_01737]|uniref:type IV secretory system conjugative DNA transfer family protein n=1 Tax=Dactylosporangium sp. NBC_01737 TaxID=2975959 RepID=UPI002E15D7D6|nr:TraM recognition domain-containing protein [Dactylosporangium sp. NBC_01737]
MSMSQQPVQPRASAGTMPLTPFVVLGAAWGAIALTWLAWAAGALTAVVTGGHPGPGYGSEFVTGMLHGRWRLLYPDVNHPVVGVVFGLFLVVAVAPVIAGWVWWERRRTEADDPLPSLARPHEVADLTPAGVTKRALQLRPSLAGTPANELPAAQTGLALGTMQRPHRRFGPQLRASWEDGIVAIMGPRAQKTTAIAVPLILDAPGPVVATSNKADLWATTSAARARVGRVWAFDPQGITRVGQRWWWDPLTAVSSVEDAVRVASHFVQPLRRDRGEDFWLLAAEDLLTSFFLAAAVSHGAMSDVQAWLADASEDQPVGILFAHGYPEVARALRGRQNGAPETRDGIYETARTAARCLQDPRIMAWVNEPADTELERFDPDAFPVSSDTLYLLSKDGAGSSGPLVAALTDQVMRHGVRRAEARGGRLDPPMLAMLDEAANICPLADLPLLYSHYGSRSIVLVTILQTYQQGSTVWGDKGMGTLWGAATVKLIGAGGDDPRFAADVSSLIGEHDVATMSLTRDGTGTVSRQVSVRRQRIMGPEDVRALKRGTAILLASGARPALLRLDPWFRQPGAPALELATAKAITQISDAAERERLIADLAQDGVQLPAVPVLGAPNATMPPAPQRPGTGPGFARVQGSDEDEGGPGAARRTVKPAVPQFRGPTRQP